MTDPKSPPDEASDKAALLETPLKNAFDGEYMAVPVVRAEDHRTVFPSFFSVNHNIQENRVRIRVFFMREERQNRVIYVRNGISSDKKNLEEIVLLEEAAIELDLKSAIALIELLSSRIDLIPREVMRANNVEVEDTPVQTAADTHGVA